MNKKKMRKKRRYQAQVAEIENLLKNLKTPALSAEDEAVVEELEQILKAVAVLCGLSTDLVKVKSFP